MFVRSGTFQFSTKQTGDNVISSVMISDSMSESVAINSANLRKEKMKICDWAINRCKCISVQV